MSLKTGVWVDHHPMVIDMQTEELTTVAQLRAFLSGTEEVRFEPSGEDTERYAFIAKVVTCERLSEAHLLPVIETLLESFPFPILGVHADNGSEYINKTVAELLDKLRIEFTKSRPRHSNDNGLAETKNGAIVRKHLGYSHIPQRFAGEVNVFCRDYLNPYVNFHRPCFFPESITDAKGKTRKKYQIKEMRTAYEKLKSLPNAESFLKPGITFEQLDQTARAISDNEAAQRLNEARQRLFQTIHRRSKHTA